jgi:hypothetical protein
VEGSSQRIWYDRLLVSAARQCQLYTIQRGDTKVHALALSELNCQNFSRPPDDFDTGRCPLTKESKRMRGRQVQERAIKMQEMPLASLLFLFSSQGVGSCSHYPPRLPSKAESPTVKRQPILQSDIGPIVVVSGSHTVQHLSKHQHVLVVVPASHLELSRCVQALTTCNLASGLTPTSSRNPAKVAADPQI